MPDFEAVAYHQGRRHFSDRGDEIKRQRTGLAANYLPISLFRPMNSGRQWAVPMVHVVVHQGSATDEEVQVTTDSVLASTVTDLIVTIVAEGHSLPQWLLDYFGHDARVRFSDRPVRSGYPSPVSVAVSAGLVLHSNTLDRLLALMDEHHAGVVRSDPGELDGAGIEAWKTRVIQRLAGLHDPLDDSASRISGEWSVSASTLGIGRASYSLTPQGMIHAGEVDGARVTDEVLQP